MLDLTKLILLTTKKAFKNNNEYRGTLAISGSWVSGLNTQDFLVPLSAVPDLVDARFNGPTDTVFGSDPRPGNAWFKVGWVWVRGDNAGAGYTNYPIPYRITALIQGQYALIRATSVSQIAPTLTLTTTPFSYRILDYSVF